VRTPLPVRFPRMRGWGTDRRACVCRCRRGPEWDVVRGNERIVVIGSGRERDLYSVSRTRTCGSSRASVEDDLRDSVAARHVESNREEGTCDARDARPIPSQRFRAERQSRRQDVLSLSLSPASHSRTHLLACILVGNGGVKP